jgi:Flp pilus assembly protein TadB
MAKRERSVEAVIAEHEKYRAQCKKRIRPAFQLVALAVLCAIGLLWWRPTEWVAALFMAAIPLFLASLELWGYRRHDRALQRLTKI